MNRQCRVLVGPFRVARRYAERRGWLPDEFIIVTRAHQLARLDPALILEIITVKLHDLGMKIVEQIREEIDRIRALFPVPTEAVL